VGEGSAGVGEGDMGVGVGGIGVSVGIGVGDDSGVAVGAAAVAGVGVETGVAVGDTRGRQAVRKSQMTMTRRAAEPFVRMDSSRNGVAQHRFAGQVLVESVLNR